jgi:hypothetical protein
MRDRYVVFVVRLERIQNYSVDGDLKGIMDVLGSEG